MNINVRFTVLVALLSLTCAWGFRTSSLSQSDRLRHELDSIEMLIQDHRRLGESIEALVRDAETLQLAIETANDRAGENENETETSSAQQEENNGSASIVLPSSPIDWAIIIVGAVAVIAIILLIILQIAQKARANRPKKHKNKPKIAPVKYKTTQPPTKPVEINSEQKAAPEWVQAMRSYDNTSNQSSPFEAPTKVVTEDAIVEQPTLNKVPSEQPVKKVIQTEQVRKQIPEVNQIPTEQPVKKVIQAEQVKKQTPEINSVVHQQVSPKPVITPEPVIKPDPVIANTKEINEAISLVEEETAPIVEEKVEPSRGTIVRDKIITMFDEGKSSIEIAKEVGMSVGEIDLVLTLARRTK